VAVKIKLKRMGKIRAPYYRIIVADARTKRDGRAIEEIGKYHPKVDPSLIEVNSDRAQYWLSVGAQPTDPVRRLLEITGDWQKFKGLPGAEGTLRTATSGPAKKDVFAAALAETLKGKAGDTKQERGRGRKSAASAADTEAKGSDAPAKGDGSARGDRSARSGAKQGSAGRQAKAGGGKPAAAKDTPAKDAPAKEAPAKEAPAKDAAAKEAPAKDAAAKDAAAKDGSATDSATTSSPATGSSAAPEAKPAEAQATPGQGGEG